MKTKEIEFYGDTLLGVQDEKGHVWLAVRKTCIDIGLSGKQANNELVKIKNDLLYNSCTLDLGWRLFSISHGGQSRETMFISEKFLPVWLAKINLTPAMRRNNPDAVDTLLIYQLEAADVLHQAFYETEEQKDTFNAKMGLEGEIINLKQEVKNLRENVQTLIDNSTINMAQQKALYNLAKERICFLLGGKKSLEYKYFSKLYFQNLWGDIKRKFDCSGSYHDLNPKDYKVVKEFIPVWDYNE